MDDCMHGWVNLCVDCLLVVAWAYGRFIHARGPLPKGLRDARHARGPAGLLPTNKQHTMSYSPKHASNHPPNHPSERSNPSSHPPIHSPTNPFMPPSTHIPIHPHTHPTNQSIHSPIHVDAWNGGRSDGWVKERVGE